MYTTERVLEDTKVGTRETEGEREREKERAEREREKKREREKENWDATAIVTK